MSGLDRVGAAMRRGMARLVPAGRRDWVEAVWAEASELPPGLPRLAWRAGAVRLVAREAGLVRRIGGLLVFAAATGLAAWAAWPGASASLATAAERDDVITTVALLAGLPLLARWFLGPADSWAARWLRVGSYTALLALLPAVVAVEQFFDTPPRGGADLLIYRLISPVSGGGPGAGEIVWLVLVALYLAAILWMTSRRSRIAPGTLTAGVSAGIALGLVMYTVAPLGLSKEATNPWLPGSDIDPLMLLAWLLLLGGPVAAAVIADRRYTAAGSSPQPTWARFRQMMAAGLLTGLTGALLVTVMGLGTTAVMLKAAWLRDWLYHGQSLLYGIQNLSADLRTLPAIAYGHQLTGAADAGVFFAICIAFPVLALVLTGLIAALRVADVTPAPGDQRPGGGGPPGPQPEPETPDGGLHEPGPDVEQDRLLPALADAAVQPAGMR